MRLFQLFVALVAFLIVAMLGSASPALAANCATDPQNSQNGVICDGVCTVPGGKTCTDCIAGGACTVPACTDPQNCHPVIVAGCQSKFMCDVNHIPRCTTQQETMSNPSTCFDGLDNDCNGHIDQADSACQGFSEVCDGFDNDYNGKIDDNMTYIDEHGQSHVVQAGQSCTVGVGACMRTGHYVCKPGAPTAVICDVHAGVPQAIDTGNNCTSSSFTDLNCNGIDDRTESACQAAQPPTCVDANNNHNGDPCTVGKGACLNTGTVVCVTDKQDPTKFVGVCDASPLPASLEGPSGPTCFDGIDNDCDGKTDLADPKCSAASLGLPPLVVQCALPLLRGGPGSDCNASRKIQYRAFLNNVQVTPDTAEMLSYDAKCSNATPLTAPNYSCGANGKITNKLITTLSVPNNATIQLASRLSSSAWRSTKTTTGYEVYAPIPLLRVTSRKGDFEGQAFCSNVPYLDVTKPDGALVSVSGSDTTPVLVAIPRVRPESLQVKVDGVQILGPPFVQGGPASPLGIVDADGLFGPVSGTVNIHGQMVDVVDLRVDVALALDQFSSNTLTMTLKNLGGGGHIIFVKGQPQLRAEDHLPIYSDVQCVKDDLRDAGIVAALEVNITEPTDQEVVTDPPPVDVSGTIKHGAHIATLKLNGKAFDVSGQEVFVPGDGENTADQYTVNFMKSLPVIDLGAAIAGTPAQLGTLQRGSNKLVAEADDQKGTRAFDNVIFSVGEAAAPVVSTQALARAEAQLQSTLQPGLRTAVEHTSNTMGIEIQNAFVAGVGKDAIDSIFQNLCTKAVNEFKKAINDQFVGHTLATLSLHPSCSCDIDAQLKLESFSTGPFNAATDCTTVFSGPVGPGGHIDITMNMPDITVEIGAHRTCETDFLGACVARTKINVDAFTNVTNAVFKYTITESQIQNNTQPDPSMRSFAWHLRIPGKQFVCNTSNHPDACVPKDGTDTGDDLGPSSNIPGVFVSDSGIECLGADICNFFVSIGSFLVSAITFGLVDTSSFFGDFDFKLADFSQLAGSAEPDATGIGKVQINKQTVENFGRAAFEPMLAAVDITGPPNVPLANAGLTASFSSTFSTQLVDTTIDPNPGAALTPAGPPTLPPTLPQTDPLPPHGSLNAFVVLSDDVINQLFASLAQSGGLQTICQDTGKTIGDFLPNCETGLTSTTLNIPNTTDPLVSAIIVASAQGACHGIRVADDCSKICQNDPTYPNQAGCVFPVDPAHLLAPETERGICHAVKGDNCNAITNPTNLLSQVAEQLVCQSFPSPHLKSTQGVLVCATQSLPPQLLIPSQGGGVQVGDLNTTLLLNDLSLAVVVDRGQNAGPGNHKLDGTLKGLPNCFSADASMNADCNLLAACVDLTVQAKMSIDNSKCAAGETGFVFSVGTVTATMDQFGYVCGVTPAQTNDTTVSTKAGTDQTVNEIKTNIGAFTPPLCAKGLDLNGILHFDKPRLISIHTNGSNANLADYFGIIGNMH